MNRLEQIFNQHNITLYNKDGSIKDFITVLDDLYLKCNKYELTSIFDMIYFYAPEVFGGLTDGRERE